MNTEQRKIFTHMWFESPANIFLNIMLLIKTKQFVDVCCDGILVIAHLIYSVLENYNVAIYP